MQQVSVHLSLLRFKSIFDERLNPSWQVLERCSSILQRQETIIFSCSLLDGLCCSAFLFQIPQRCSIGSKSGDVLVQVIVLTFLFLNTCVMLAVCFGWLSCWNLPPLPSYWRLGVILSASGLVYSLAFMVPL